MSINDGNAPSVPGNNGETTGWSSAGNRIIYTEHTMQAEEILKLRKKLSMYEMYGLRLGFCNESIEAFEDLIKIMKTYFTWHELTPMQKIYQLEIDPEVLPEDFRNNLNENFIFFLLNDAKHELLDEIIANINEKQQTTPEDEKLIMSIKNFKKMVNLCKTSHFELNLRKQDENSVIAHFLTVEYIRRIEEVQAFGRKLYDKFSQYPKNFIEWNVNGFEPSLWKDSNENQNLWSGTFEIKVNSPETALEIKEIIESTLYEAFNEYAVKFFKLTDFQEDEKYDNYLKEHASYRYFMRGKSGEII